MIEIICNVMVSIFAILGILAIVASIIFGIVLNNFSLVFVAIFVLWPIYLWLLSYLGNKIDERW
jgi:hypothetical protein